MRNAVQILVVIVIAGLAMWVWRAPLASIYRQTAAVLRPCATVVTYRLGFIDRRFGLSTSTALSSIEEAAGLWNAEREGLLQYDEARGDVVIDFAYDTRQETTQTLQGIGQEIDGSRTSYDALKAQYDAAYADYSREKQAFAAANEMLQSAAAVYERQVEQWNGRGGAPRDAYEQMQQRKAELDAEQSRLAREQDRINAQVDQVNTLASRLNTLARELNLDVAAYNIVGGEARGEFEQGVYTSGLAWRGITIFEYENRVKLVRVLAHELGHALALDHVDDTKAIMAELNGGGHAVLSTGDVHELDRVCAQSPFAILWMKFAERFSSSTE